MSIRLVFEKNTYLNDVQEIPRAFVPYIELSDEGENYLSWEYEVDGKDFSFTIKSDLFGTKKYVCSFEEKDELIFKRKTKYFAKNSLYSYLSSALGVGLPYGSLTGVRPTRMYGELSKTYPDPKKALTDEFFVSESKASLVEKCALFQEKYINNDVNSVGLYVNVPFCPTRCSYCSFISTEAFRVKKELPAYVDQAVKDVYLALDIIEKKGYSVRSIYIGGGTPTSLEPELLHRLLQPLSNLKKEFTVECGRPDTVNEEVIDTLVANNVTRVSVNPQTFHQKTLDLIGRKHSVEDVYKAFELAKNGGFDINCDLICALPGESFDDFSYSLRKAISLAPDNITVHTLSIKRGSELNKDKAEKNAAGEALKMTNFSFDTLTGYGYMPYYMYRQKNTADNLENTGFCKDGKVCLYNVDTMEESCAVLAVGAGAVSKKLSDGGRITRFSHPKGFREYLERAEETQKKMIEFFLA